MYQSIYRMSRNVLHLCENFRLQMRGDERSVGSPRFPFLSVYLSCGACISYLSPSMLLSLNFVCTTISVDSIRRQKYTLQLPRIKGKVPSPSSSRPCCHHARCHSGALWHTHAPDALLGPVIPRIRHARIAPRASRAVTGAAPLTPPIALRHARTRQTPRGRPRCLGAAAFINIPVGAHSSFVTG